MDKKRAKEIISSPSMITVTCDGKPVYIDTINENSNTAHVHPLDAPNQKQEVALSNLVEQ